MKKLINTNKIIITIWKILIYFTFFLFSLGQGGRISFLNQQVNFYLYEILMLMILILVISFYFINKLQFFLIKNSFNKLKIVYFSFGYLIFSFFIKWGEFALKENIIAFLYLLRLILYFSYFLFLFYFLKANKKPVKETIKKGLMIFIIITIITSLTQFFLYPSLYNLRYLGWDVHENRLFGVFLDTSVAGAIFGLIFFFLLNLSKNFKKQLFLPIYFILIILTYSRSIYLSFLATFFFYLVKRKLGIYFIAIVLIFIILIIIIPRQTGPGVGLFRFFSIEARFKENLKGIEVGLKNPIFGVGYNRTRYVKEKLNLLPKNEFDIYHSASSFQSSYVTIFVTSGLIGLGLFIFLLNRLIKISPLMNWSIIFIGLAAVADNLFFHPFIIFLLGNFALVLSQRFKNNF